MQTSGTCEFILCATSFLGGEKVKKDDREHQFKHKQYVYELVPVDRIPELTRFRTWMAEVFEMFIDTQNKCCKLELPNLKPATIKKTYSRMYDFLVRNPKLDFLGVYLRYSRGLPQIYLMNLAVEGANPFKELTKLGVKQR